MVDGIDEKTRIALDWLAGPVMQWTLGAGVRRTWRPCRRHISTTRRLSLL